MIIKRKFLWVGVILLIGLCLVNKVASEEEEEEEVQADEFYDDNYGDVEDVKFATDAPVILTTTLPELESKLPAEKTAEKQKLPVNVLDQIADAIEGVEDDFEKSLNEHDDKVEKKPAEAKSDLVYDNGSGEDDETYDEGEDPEPEENGADKESSTLTKVIERLEENEIEEEEEGEDSNEDGNGDEVSQVVKEEGTENKLGNAAQVRMSENVESKKAGFDLKKAYIIIPVASVVLVSLVLGTLLFLVKKTNAFKKKSASTNDSRKQIYKSVEQQDPVV